MIDRLPPYDLIAEQGAIGCMLLDRVCVQSALFDKEMFYDLRHQLIFDDLKRSESEGLPTELLAVIARLTAQGVIQKVGGTEYLISLESQCPTAGLFSHFVGLMTAKWKWRRLIRFGTEMVTRAYDPEETPEESLDGAISELMQYQKEESKIGTIHKMGDVVGSAVADLERIYNNPGTLDGISCGFPDLDEIVGGLNPPDYFIIGARPGYGKTSLAMNMAESMAARDGVPVGVFSLEMSNIQLTKRMLLGKASITTDGIRRKQVSERDFTKLFVAAKEIQKAPIYMCDMPMGLSELRKTAREMVSKYSVKVGILDYLQLARTEKSETRNNAIGEISNGLKAIAKELGLIWIVLSQLSRDIEQNGNGRVPRLSDLRDSGNVEQDADIIGFLHNEKDEKGNVTTKLIIAKHRHGATGQVPLFFDKQFTTFRAGTKQPYRDD